MAIHEEARRGFGAGASAYDRGRPAAQVLEGTAEALPVGEGSADAIVVAQAFHWFDVPRALAEFHRVLRPGGRLALIWNRRRLDQPLHRALDEIIEPWRGDAPSHHRGEWTEPVASSGLFGRVAELEVPSEQLADVDGMVDRVASTSFIAALPQRDRHDVLGRVRELASGWSGELRLGYLTEAYAYERR